VVLVFADVEMPHTNLHIPESCEAAAGSTASKEKTAAQVAAGFALTDLSVWSSHLSKVSRMVFVHVDSVVVLSSSITTTSRMLPVLSNTSVSSTDMTPLFPVLVQVCMASRHAAFSKTFVHLMMLATMLRHAALHGRSMM